MAHFPKFVFVMFTLAFIACGKANDQSNASSFETHDNLSKYDDINHDDSDSIWKCNQDKTSCRRGFLLSDNPDYNATWHCSIEKCPIFGYCQSGSYRFKYQWTCSANVKFTSNDKWECQFKDGFSRCAKKMLDYYPPEALRAYLEHWVCKKDELKKEIKCQMIWKCNSEKSLCWREFRNDEIPDKPVDSYQEYYPPYYSAVNWICKRSEIIKGVQCQHVSAISCKSGQKRWCAGSLSSRWGIVECDPRTATWKTTIIHGQRVLDCKDAIDPNTKQHKVPNKEGACYYPLFNPELCERYDCIVPDAANKVQGKTCPPSQGNTCDYCDPFDVNSCNTNGAKDKYCVQTHAGEAFCTNFCHQNPCQAGYACLPYSLPQGISKLCLPQTLGCFSPKFPEISASVGP